MDKPISFKAIIVKKKSLMKFLRLLLLLVFVGAGRIYAQGTIKGVIIDEQRQPLPSAVIHLKQLPDSVLKKITVSDPFGLFVLNAAKAGSYVVQISFAGYHTRTVNIKLSEADSELNMDTIVLLPITQQLREVAITAQAPQIEHQVDKTVVNVGQNIVAAGTNVLELLKKLPGVQVTPDGQISLYGKSGVNVNIDGKTTFLSAEDLANLLTNMPSSDISKIEIMTNPSAKYDASGTGGIINLIRKKNTRSGLNGSLTSSFGQGYYSRYNSGLVLNYKTDGYNLYLNDSYGYNKGYNQSNGTSDILNDGALVSEQISTNTGITTNKTYNSSAGLDLYLSKKTTLTLTGSVSDRRYDNKLNSVMTTTNNHQIPTGSEKFLALNIDHPLNFAMGMQLLHKPDTTVRYWSAAVDYANFNYRPGQYNTALNYDVSGKFQSQDNVFIDESRTLRIFGARADDTQPLPGGGKLEMGLKSSYVKTLNNSIYYNQIGGQNVADPAQSVNDNYGENINAAYVNFNWQYRKLTVQAGLRAEQTVMKGLSVDQNYLGLFPTLFLNEKLSDQQTLNFQFGRRTDRPDYHEYVPFRRALSATISFLGNPNLKPDFNWHSQLTWAWRNSIFITVAYDMDRDYMRTLYYLDSNKTTITRMPTNIPKAHSWNVDVSYQKELAKWFTTNTTATVYQNLFNGIAGNGFSLDDPGFATIDFVTNNSFRFDDRLSMEADFEYESKRQFVGSVFGAYATLDLALRQKLFHGQGSLTISGTNVLDTDNRSAIDHYLNLNQYGYSHIYSRAVIATFTFRFGSGKFTKTQNISGSEEEQKRAGN
jgi:hypothetical protein